MKSHQRSGVHVDKYVRGEGGAPAKPRRVIARVASIPSASGFRVVVDGRGFEVKASTFVGALDSGLERTSGSPQHVTITKEVK